MPNLRAAHGPPKGLPRTALARTAASSVPVCGSSQSSWSAGRGTGIPVPAGERVLRLVMDAQVEHTIGEFDKVVLDERAWLSGGQLTVGQNAGAADFRLTTHLATGVDDVTRRAAPG